MNNLYLYLFNLLKTLKRNRIYFSDLSYDVLKEIFDNFHKTERFKDVNIYAVENDTSGYFFRSDNEKYINTKNIGLMRLGVTGEFKENLQLIFIDFDNNIGIIKSFYKPNN